MTELRRRMDNDMVVSRGMAPKTREAYLGAVTGLARYYRRPPDQSSADEVQAYLLELLQVRKRAWSTVNIAVHGLRFLYHVTLKQDRVAFSIPAGHPPATLPHILSDLSSLLPVPRPALQVGKRDDDDSAGPNAVDDLVGESGHEQSAGLLVSRDGRSGLRIQLQSGNRR